MKCARCSNELSGSSTFCPKCGLNQQNLSYTAPENYTGMGRERPATFSYLPAGTPPWPTSVPQNVPGIVSPVPQSQSAPQSRTKVEGKPRRTVGGVLSVIAVLVLAPLIGILITFAAIGRPATQATPVKTGNSGTQQQKAATPAPATNGNPSLPTPTSFKTAKDTNVNISLLYPADWTQGNPDRTTTSNSLSISSQQQIGIIFSVTHLNDTVSTSITNPDQINQSYLQQLAQIQGVHGIQSVQAANTQPSIAGAKWIEKDATFLDSSDVKMRFSTISVQHGKSYYVIYFFIPDGIYAEAMQKYIGPMLNSVKFLS